MTAGGTVTTEMTCEHENDTLLPATLEIAAAPEGDVVWKAGEKVLLEANTYDEGDGWRVHQVTLRGGPESVLMVAIVDGLLAAENVTTVFFSLAVGYAFACEGAPGEELPLRLDFTPYEGTAFGVVSGHRGLMPISDGLGYSIDLADARGTTIEPFSSSDIEVLLRRVSVGG